MTQAVVRVDVPVLMAGGGCAGLAASVFLSNQGAFRLAMTPVTVRTRGPVIPAAWISS